MVFVRVFPLRCGTISAPSEVFENGLAGRRRLPVWSYLIRHPKRGMALMDTGLHPALHGRTLGGLFEMEAPAGSDVASRLASLNMDAGLVQRVVLSHCHLDHIAALGLLPNADLFVQAAELDEALSRARGNPERDLLELGHKTVSLSGAFDLFGDGSVEVFPTPGHSCGHQSVRVLGDRPLVLAGDACYFCNSLERNAEQPNAWSRTQHQASMKILQEMKSRGAVIVPGHDDPCVPAAATYHRSLVMTKAADLMVQTS